jgi:hypothetical protein
MLAVGLMRSAAATKLRCCAASAAAAAVALHCCVPLVVEGNGPRVSKAPSTAPFGVGSSSGGAGPAGNLVTCLLSVLLSQLKACWSWEQEL